MSVEIRGISKRFGRTAALDDVTINISTGQFAALLAPNGGGKTTLLRIVAGLAAADRGQVVIDGTDVTGLPPEKRHLGFVFQHGAMINGLTVAENIRLALEHQRRPPREVAVRVNEMLDLVELAGFGAHNPAQLSAGQRQRAALARALAPAPTVLLMDDPFAGLDVQVRRDMAMWLRQTLREESVTTLFATRDQGEALLLADRVIVLRDGQTE